MRDDIHNMHQHRHGPWQARGHGPWGREQGEHHGPHPRGRRPGPGGGREWEEFFGSEGGWPWGGRHGGHGGPGAFGFAGGRERLERGLLRYIILAELKDGPKHGYEIIKSLEEKTRGRYSPSPGTLYPTLQYLEDLGLVGVEQEADRRVYHVTDSGRAELEKQGKVVEGFWSRFGDRGDRMPSGQNMQELKFAGDALKDLLRTVGEGIKSGAFTSDADAIRRIRLALEKCQNELREIIAQSASRPAAATRNESTGNTEAFGTGEEKSF